MSNAGLFQQHHGVGSSGLSVGGQRLGESSLDRKRRCQRIVETGADELRTRCDQPGNLAGRRLSEQAGDGEIMAMQVVRAGLDPA